MKSAFFYPGQGSQSVGMGIPLADAFPEARATFDSASEITGYNMYELCSEGPMDKLSQTSFTQPALFTVEAAITDVLKSRGVVPSMAAGHSLGEFAAWYAAEVFSFEDGLRLVSERGRIMDNADPDGIGGMAAVIGLSPEDIKKACDEVDGVVVVANLNSPLQTVISGSKDAVKGAGAKLKKLGAKRFLPLKVSGAFHSPLMESAQSEFSGIVSGLSLSDASFPVFSNVTAEPVTSASDIKRLIVDQLTSPVRWTETIQSMVSQGVNTAYEIGPGNVIAGLVKRIDSGLSVSQVSDTKAVQEVTNG